MVAPEKPELLAGSDYALRVLNSYVNVANRRGYKPKFERREASAKKLKDTENQAEISYSREWKQREPKDFAAVFNSVLDASGWAYGLSVGILLDESRWEEIVGPNIAQHASIEKFADGVLVLSADSSAWATQLRTLSSQIITRINEVVGQNLVVELKVSGPSQKSWNKGKRSVKWRGPRDTYG